MAEFKVGGKVICVKTYTAKIFETLSVKKNTILTVRKIHLNTPPYYLYFDEIIAPKDERGIEYAYDGAFFLPLDDFKEISFTKINEEVPVSAQ